MAYFHVLLSYSPEGSMRCVLFDLSEADLKRHFLKNYRRGANLLVNGEVLETKTVRRVQIIRTGESIDIELNQLQESSWREVQDFNRSQDSVTLISPWRGYERADVAEVGTDVTSEHIDGPPGEGQWPLIQQMVNHPWVSAIATGLIVAGIVAMF